MAAKLQFLWYGYVEQPSGDLKVKRFYSHTDIRELQQKTVDEISYVTPMPYEATNKDGAILILKSRIRQLGD